MRRSVILKISLTVAFVLAASCDNTEDIRGVIVGDIDRSVINAVAIAVGNDTRSHNAVCYEVQWDESDRIFVTEARILTTSPSPTEPEPPRVHSYRILTRTGIHPRPGYPVRWRFSPLHH